MGSFYRDYDASWTTDGTVNSSSVTNASTATSDAYSNDTKLNTRVSIEIAYGSAPSEGVKVYILADVDGTNFEDANSAPWGFEMPYAASTTIKKAFDVPAHINDFKVYLTNDTGDTITATMRVIQAIGTTA